LVCKGKIGDKGDFAKESFNPLSDLGTVFPEFTVFLHSFLENLNG